MEITSPAGVLGASHGIFYLASGERDQLFSVAVGGAPPGIFAVPECILSNSPYASAVAYRTARTVSQGDLKDEYSLRLMPYPHYVIAVPLTAGGDTFGVLTGQWAPTDPRERRRVLLRMEELGRNFGPELAKYFLRYAGVWPGESPLIIPMFPSSPTADGPLTVVESQCGLISDTRRGRCELPADHARRAAPSESACRILATG